MEVRALFSFERVYKVILIVVLATALFLVLFRFFDHDEFEAIHSIWKIAQGERIYTDFANQHHPLMYYASLPVWYLFGESVAMIIAMRMIMFFFFIGMLWCTYRMAQDVWGREVGYISVLFLASTMMFLQKAIEVRPDVPQTFFTLWSGAHLVRYALRRERTHLYASAILMGISFLFLQKALFAVLFVGAVFLSALYKKVLPIKDICLYGGLFVLVQMPYLVYLFWSGQFQSYLVWNWIMNAKLDVVFLPYKFMTTSFTENSILWLFYAFGMLWFLKTPLQRFLGAASVFLFFSVFLVPAPSQQYYMMALPFVAMVSAAGFYGIWRDAPKAYTLGMVLAVAMPFVSLGYAMTNSLSGGEYNDRQLKKIQYVLSHTKPDDFVYDGDIQFNVFRKDLDFFWFSVSPHVGQLSTYKKWKGYEYDIYQLIEQKKPKIISTYTISKNLSDPRIVSFYIQSEEYPDLYIRKD